MQDGPAARRVGGMEGAAVLRDDAVRQGQADAVPAGFGGEEWYENTFQIFRRDAGAGVRDGNNGTGRRIFQCTADRDAANAVVVVNGFGGVA